MDNKTTYKQVDLFGNEKLVVVSKKQKKQISALDYDGFIEKFEPKKTTDDCYTPPEVYDIVLRYVADNCDLSEKNILRPFYPGGDYESIEYCANDVVIDNPPFSIISKIARYYLANGVKFFLFAPHMTLFSADIDCTALVVGAGITYQNGAVVKTSFLSNMFGDLRVIGVPKLHSQLESLNVKVGLPVYKYPNYILTVSAVQWMVERGVSFCVEKAHTAYCRGLDDQKKHKKALFGSGFLLSEKAAAEKAAAEKAAAEKAAAKDANIIVWELSEREKNIIKNLG